MTPKPKGLPCPNCGQPVEPVALDPDTPPWLCATCSRGWWDIELRNGQHWDPTTRDFGPNTQSVLDMAYAERDRARKRMHP